MPHKASAWQDIINPEDLKLAEKNLKLHFEDPNHKYDQIVRYTHKDGHIIWIQCRWLAIRDNEGNPTRMLGSHTDVTKLKEKEEELRKYIDILKKQEELIRIIEITKEQNERLKNFAHIVSHNLKSHSSNFEMLLNILFTENPEMKENELLTYLNTASTNLKETIEHLNKVVSINTTIQENITPID